MSDIQYFIYFTGMDTHIWKNIYSRTGSHSIKLNLILVLVGKYQCILPRNVTLNFSDYVYVFIVV